MPKLSLADLATKAAIELVDALKNPMLSAAFAPIIMMTKMRALETISEIFSGAVKTNLPKVKSKQRPKKRLPRVQDEKKESKNTEQKSPRGQTRYPTRELKQLINAETW